MDEGSDKNDTMSAQDESLFYTLVELDQYEEELSKQQFMYGGSPNNPHMLLMPQ